MIIRFAFYWYDLWIGFYYERETGILYFCPFPTLAIEFQRCPGKFWIGLRKKNAKFNY